MARRVLILALAVAWLHALFGASAHADLRIDAGAEVAAIDGGPKPSFLDGDASMSALRYGDGDNGIDLTSAFLQISGSVVPTWNATVALDLNTQADQEVGVSEAALLWRPLPFDGIRARIKLGAFRPPISLEHSGEGWSTLYTMNASAINSWVGEELGGLGVEMSLKSDAAADPYAYYWSLGGAAFYGDDPAGTLLSWRGWSVNNWQTRWGDSIKLSDLPIIDYAPGQRYRAEPFLELDNRVGYYVNGEIGRADTWRLRALAYDNRADANAEGSGQSGWRTHFASFGFQGSLPGDIGLVTQWLTGRTYWGPKLDLGRPVDNDFDSEFVLLTRVWGAHRFSVRRDWFQVDDNDLIVIDPNRENGDAWTLSYQFRYSEHWLAGLEWLRIRSARAARTLDGDAVRLIEACAFATLRWTY